jgi:DNA-binding XRE family transcriptional regulator
MMNFDVSPLPGHDRRMSQRVRKLLEQADMWCSQKRGRQSQLADYLGVSRHAVNAWFSEYQKETPKRHPTAEQILALMEFL